MAKPNPFVQLARDKRAKSPALIDQVLTAEQVAKRLQIEPSTVHEWARRGVLPSLPISRTVRRFLRSDIERWLEEMRQPIDSAEVVALRRRMRGSRPR